MDKSSRIGRLIDRDELSNGGPLDCGPIARLACTTVQTSSNPRQRGSRRSSLAGRLADANGIARSNAKTALPRPCEIKLDKPATQYGCSLSAELRRKADLPCGTKGQWINWHSA